MAEEIGLPQRAKDVAEMLVLRSPLTREFLQQIADAKRVPIEAIAMFEGRELAIFRHEAICGGLLLAALPKDGGPTTRVEVPMAFQSALAGVMLAAEVVLEMTGRRSQFGRASAILRMDLLRPLLPTVTFPEAPRPNCICADADYLEAFTAKYAN